MFPEINVEVSFMATVVHERVRIEVKILKLFAAGVLTVIAIVLIFAVICKLFHAYYTTIVKKKQLSKKLDYIQLKMQVCGQSKSKKETN